MCEFGMLNILISGACGRMGRKVAECAQNDNELNIIAGVDVSECLMPYPVFSDFDSINVKPDVIIDFSHVSVLEKLLEYAVRNNIPVVLATTGYKENQVELIKETSKKIPVFFTFNMSLGVNLLCSLVKTASKVLGEDFDIEIVEKHHNQKLDAPSGTAIMLANAANSQFDNKLNYEYDRHSKRNARPKNEIGIHSIRGGSIPGDHDVIFAGNNEVITLSHHAQSRDIFANGALKAAKFLVKQSAGLYDMNDCLNL